MAVTQSLHQPVYLGSPELSVRWILNYYHWYARCGTTTCLVHTKLYAIVPPVKLSDIPLPKLERFKYMGYWVIDDLNDNVDIEWERRAL